ncbi:MAG: UDP-N-acetylmuramoyl-L-alanyl-D-glutamate--2,6-diaminopimelate ligase, partial [Bacteroidaceae bacterium]|nr:UDP-N-acetylmuramoyl-L-alanyl-D-glutamate--2,6-diaminopimelate ligase [Bacteroidaceae bacterium]
MKIQNLLKGLQIVSTTGNDDKEITGVNIDSRLIEKGHMFIAMKGTQVDGHAYIGKAIEKGASAIVCEDLPATLNDDVCYIKVKDCEDVVGPIATHFYGDPTSKLDLVGVTGTNGKTTIATLLYHMFRKFGYKVGLVSTVCNYIDDKAVPTDHTTPDPITLNKLLGEMADAGCKYAFMEVSSHSVAQKRIGGLKFRGGIFTNLTRDHIDYHKTFENYRDAKKGFFDALPKGAFAITNLDDKNGLFMTQNTKAEVKTYSVQSIADFKGKILEMSFEGMYLDINGKECGVQFIGKFNVQNLLAVYGTARMLGKKEEDILLILSTLKSVSGR